MLDLETRTLERLQANASEASALLKALANEKRLLILCQLGEREMSVGQLQEMVGLSQSALSQHLALLREDGLVATRRDGASIYYRNADDRALKVIKVLAEIYCPDLVSSKG